MPFRTLVTFNGMSSDPCPRIFPLSLYYLGHTKMLSVPVSFPLSLTNILINMSAPSVFLFSIPPVHAHTWRTSLISMLLRQTRPSLQGCRQSRHCMLAFFSLVVPIPQPNSVFNHTHFSSTLPPYIHFYLTYLRSRQPRCRQSLLVCK